MCQREDVVTHQVVKLCAMHEREYGDRCLNPALEGSDFCAECVTVKLCKSSGITYLFEGNSDICMLQTMPHHPVDDFGPKAPTKRKQFCSDRCRNLWRDTQPRRERQVEVAKLENGERSERYALISNYCNSGQKVVVDKQTNRVVS
jgi:hypothetical protein